MCPGGTDRAETGSELVGYLGEDWKFMRGDSNPQHRGKEAYLRHLEASGLRRALLKALVALQAELEAGTAPAEGQVVQWLRDRIAESRRRAREAVRAKAPGPAAETAKAAGE